VDLGYPSDTAPSAFPWRRLLPRLPVLDRFLRPGTLLRRDLEAAADDEAAAAAGAGPLLSALAKVALAITAPAG
jgi:hypothetical protein